MSLIVFRRGSDRAQIGWGSDNAAIPIIPDVKRCIRTMGVMKALGIVKFNLHLQPIKKSSSYCEHDVVLNADTGKFYKNNNCQIGINERQSMPPYKLQDGFQFLESCFDGVHTFLLLPLNSSTECLNQKLKMELLHDHVL